MVVSFSKNLSLGHYPFESCSLDQVLLVRQCLGDLWLPERASMEQILHNRNPARMGHDIILERQRERGRLQSQFHSIPVNIPKQFAISPQRDTMTLSRHSTRPVWISWLTFNFLGSTLGDGLDHSGRRGTSRLGRFQSVMPATQV